MYRIFFRQIDKNTGRRIGRGQSVDMYETVDEANGAAVCMEFEDENFKQEIVAISDKNPFVGMEDEE